MQRHWKDSRNYVLGTNNPKRLNRNSRSLVASRGSNCGPINKFENLRQIAHSTALNIFKFLTTQHNKFFTDNSAGKQMRGIFKDGAPIICYGNA